MIIYSTSCTELQCSSYSPAHNASRVDAFKNARTGTTVAVTLAPSDRHPSHTRVTR